MEGRAQQVNLLLRQQKAAWVEQDQRHQERILEQRRVFKAHGPHSSSTKRGGDVEAPEALTPRMSFERQLTGELLKQLLEKVFDAADEDSAGTRAS